MISLGVPAVVVSLLPQGPHLSDAESDTFRAHRDPVCHFTANPEASPARTTVDNSSGHIPVTLLIQVHRIGVTQAEHARDFMRVHQLVDVDQAAHPTTLGATTLILSAEAPRLGA